MLGNGGGGGGAKPGGPGGPPIGGGAPPGGGGGAGGALTVRWCPPPVCIEGGDTGLGVMWLEGGSCGATGGPLL